MYESLDLERGGSRIKAAANGNRKMEILFKNIGIFPLAEPVVFSGAAPTRQLLDLQIEVNQRLADGPPGMNGPYFTPRSWTADCQLTAGITRERLFEAVSTAMEMPLPLTGTLDEIGLAEFHSAKRLFAFPFAQYSPPVMNRKE
ncbi:MAG TPA: hypothetical protein VLZ89_10445 [Anaerolineales bacterium]|nr:hypothetical protein [Anaerolineales bacterium]